LSGKIATKYCAYTVAYLGGMASATQHEEMLAAFPYPPYEIQQQLMINVYEALQNKQIGLFESPTGAIPRSTCAEQALLLLQCLLLLTPCCNPAGTGKTLSMICSTLKWLEDERQAQAAAAAAAAAAAKAAGGVQFEKGHICMCLPACVLTSASTWLGACMVHCSRRCACCVCR
jgi:hypothetical protein